MDSGGKNRRAVVFCQLVIRLIEDDLIITMLLNAGFQVVALDDPGNATEVFEGIHMGAGPRLLVHGEEGFHIAVTAVGQGRHEHIGRDDLTGFVIQVNDGVGLCQIVGVVLVELGGLGRDLARGAALAAVFQPQQVQGDAAARELLVDTGLVWNFVDGLRGTGREQVLRELLV